MQQFSRYINLCGVLTRTRGALDRQERSYLSLFSIRITKQLILIPISLEGGWRIRVEGSQVVGAKTENIWESYWDSSVIKKLPGGYTAGVRFQCSSRDRSSNSHFWNKSGNYWIYSPLISVLPEVLSAGLTRCLSVLEMSASRWNTWTHYSNGYKETFHFYFLM